MQHIYLLRGNPGSGKSFLANIIHNWQEYVWLEADMYFIEDGEYKFDKTKLKEAHGWCQGLYKGHLKDGHNIIVSNTFTKKWEMQFYKDLAAKYGAKVTEIIVRSDDFGSIHNVPEETIERMKREFEY
jgi:predicted kinase